MSQSTVTDGARRYSIAGVLRVIGLGLLGLVALIAGLAVAFYVFPPGWLARELVQRAVKDATGRTLSVGGKSKLTLRPDIRLSLEKVSLSGSDNVQSEPTLSSEHVEITVQIIDLWKAAFEVPTITLKQPDLRLKAGDKLLARLAEGKVRAGGFPKAILVSNGKVRLADASGQQTFYLDKVTGRINRSADGKGFGFDGSVGVKHGSATVKGSLNDVSVLADGGRSPIEVTLVHDLAKGSISGAVATRPIGQFTGNLNVETGKLPALLEQFKVDTTNINIGDAARLDGRIAGSLRKLSFSDFNISMDPIKGQLNGSLSIEKSRPVIQARLSTDLLDVDSLLPKAARPMAFALETLDHRTILPTAWQSLLNDLRGLGKTGNGVQLAAIVPDSWWNSRAFKTTKFPDIAGELEVKAAKIRYGQLSMEEGELALKSQPDRLKILLKKIKLHGGDFSGVVDFGLSKGSFLTDLKLKFRKMRVEPFIAELFTKRLVNGTSDADVTLVGQGSTMRELVGSMDGSAVVRIEAGEIIGYDLRRAVLNFGLGQSYNPLMRTKFDKVSASFALRNGVLRSTEDLSLSGPEVELKSHGSLGLVSGRVDQRLTLTLKPPPLHLPIPLRVRGTFEKPIVNWDIFSAVAEPAKFATPFSVGVESESMPDEVRTEIMKILADDSSKTRLSAAARQFLEQLLQKWARTPGTAALAPSPASTQRSVVAERLRQVKKWHYQLQSLRDVETLARSDNDLLVIDFAKSGNGAMIPFSKSGIDALKTKPDGSRRLVVAYFSIGEAERYRDYWQKSWNTRRPDWILEENCNWPGNYVVKFWADEWKNIIYAGQNSYLQSIKAAGFDGVYLDRVDVYWELREKFPQSQARMTEFVDQLAAEGRRNDPEFIIIAQNAEGLLEDVRYRRIIDGIAKEDLLYGLDGTGQRNDSELIEWSRDMLRLLAADGKAVLAVEYLRNAKQIASAREELSRNGIVGVFPTRALDGGDPLTSPASLGIQAGAPEHGTPEYAKLKCQGAYRRMLSVEAIRSLRTRSRN